MFKRVQKANAEHDKRLKKGIEEEDQGPRELAMDMDSDSDSSEGSDSESSSSASSSEDEKTSKAVKNGKTTETVSKKRKLEEEEEDSDDDESDDDSDEDSDEGESASNDIKPVKPVDDALLDPSIQKALDEPIFVKPDAIVRQGYTHRSCHLCPQTLIKTEKMIDTHLKSGSHNRKVKRYSKETELLKPEQLKEPSEGGMRISELRERVEKKVAKQQEGQRKVRAHAKQMQLEARRKRAVNKAINRQVRKEAKAAKKAVIAAGGKKIDGKSPNKKQKIEGEQQKEKKVVANPSSDDSSKQFEPKEKKPKSIAKDIIQQKLAVLKQTEKDPRKLTKKYVKKHLLTAAERDELKKVKNHERAQLKFEVRQRKREKKAAANAAKNGSEE
ncbi:hypothetical protein L7F22_019464 [Adiantum nelumboides]|nr:hypothetical protein [Adiantum nelumboides]